MLLTWLSYSVSHEKPPVKLIMTQTGRNEMLSGQLQQVSKQKAARLHGLESKG